MKEPQTELCFVGDPIVVAPDVEVAPEYIHLLPAGDYFVARDGREFRVGAGGLAAVVSRSITPALLDYDHEADKGGSTEAAGWITDYEVRPEGLFGRVKWTSEGAEDVLERAYRFQSPVLSVAQDTREIVAIRGASLTNKPALYLKPITETLAEQPPAEQPAEQPAEPPAELAAVQPAEQQSELLAVVQSELAAVRAELAAVRAEQTERERVTLLDDAAREGRVTPAQRPVLEALSVDVLRALLPTLPVLCGSAPAPAAPPADPDAELLSKRYGYAPELVQRAREAFQAQRAER